MIEYLSAAALIVGVIFVFWFFAKGKPRKEVMFLRPRDKRGERMLVTRETDISLVCDRTVPVHRFIKAGPGYTFDEGGKPVTRFFGVEGTAYTTVFAGDEELKVPVPDFLKAAWGKKVYNALPKKLKDRIEKDRFGVTIEPTKIEEEKYGLPTLTADDINDEVTVLFWRGSLGLRLKVANR